MIPLGPRWDQIHSPGNPREIVCGATNDVPLPPEVVRQLEGIAGEFCAELIPHFECPDTQRHVYAFRMPGGSHAYNCRMSESIFARCVARGLVDVLDRTWIQRAEDAEVTLPGFWSRLAVAWAIIRGRRIAWEVGS